MGIHPLRFLHQLKAYVMYTYELRELKVFSEMVVNYPLLQQLNAHLSLRDYEEMLKDMLRNNYRQLAVYDGDECIALSGFWINTKIYSGKYLEPDNVVVDIRYRSKGIGALMCNWLTKKAQEEGCKRMLLDVFVNNKDAHRFYFREGFMIEGFHMFKVL